MAFELQLVFSGLTVGAIYALVAIGFSLIYSASGVFNFAQGEFVMLGGMITASGLAAGLTFAPAAAAAVASTVAIGLALYGIGIRSAGNASPVVLLIITVGASLLIRGLASVYLGKDFVTFPGAMSTEVLSVGGAIIQTQGLVVMTGATVLLAFLWVFLNKSLLGKSLRAVAADRLAALLVGLNPTLIIALSFGLSAAIGSIGGVLITPMTLTSYDGGTLLSVKGFAAAMLGGMGHPAGPVVGGLLIGLLEAFGAGHVSSAYKDVFALVALLAILLLRPDGLLGGPKVERV